MCVHGYLFPLPVVIGRVPHSSYDTTAGGERLNHDFLSSCREDLRLVTNPMLMNIFSVFPVQNTHPTDWIITNGDVLVFL